MATTLSTAQLLEIVNWRYATKKFDPSRKIPADVWTKLEDALVLAPSSFGLQPWKFLVVQSPALREKLVGVSWGQRQVADASHLVVFAFRKGLDNAHIDRFLKRQSEVTGAPLAKLEEGYGKIIKDSIGGAAQSGRLDAWQARQVYIALGHFMFAAATLGIDTCPMEGLDPAQYDEILGLKGTEYSTLFACPAGYRAADDKYATSPKIRFPKADVVQYL